MSVDVVYQLFLVHVFPSIVDILHASLCVCFAYMCARRRHIQIRRQRRDNVVVMDRTRVALICGSAAAISLVLVCEPPINVACQCCIQIPLPYVTDLTVSTYNLPIDNSLDRLITQMICIGFVFIFVKI